MFVCLRQNDEIRKGSFNSEQGSTVINDRQKKFRDKLRNKWTELKRDVDKAFDGYQKKSHNAQKVQPNCNHPKKRKTNNIYSNVYDNNDRYYSMSVRDLKDKLHCLGIYTDDCIEKKDLIRKLKYCDHYIKNTQYMHNHTRYKGNNNHNDRIKNSNLKNITNKCINIDANNVTNNDDHKSSNNTTTTTVEEYSDEIKAEIDGYIKEMSYKKSLRQLLNSIFEYKPTDPRYLKHGCHTDKIKKTYRQAILKLHPDKHVNSCYETKYISQELFKIITSKHDKYKSIYNI